MRFHVLGLLVICTLPGCSVLSGLGGGPERDVYELLPDSGSGIRCTRTRAGELVIETPKARTALETDRIMIRPSALQTQYLPGAQWGDTVPDMVQSLMVNSFADTGAFRHVGRSPLGGVADLSLLSEIHEFNAVVTDDGVVVRMTVDVQLLREADSRILARERFAAERASPGTKAPDLLPVFDAASKELMDRITDWGLRAAGGRAAVCGQR